MCDYSFEITEEISVLSTNAKGWTKELNRVSYGKNPAMLRIQEWIPDKSRMTKGITLTDQEAMNLRNALIEYFGDKKESKLIPFPNR